MKYIFPIIAVLILAAMLTGPVMGAVVTTYNQTYVDTDNDGRNIWTSVALWQTVWAVKGGAQMLVVNTSVTSSSLWGINLTVKAGPFFRRSLGDKKYTLSRNETYILGPFELARFKQANETLLFQSNATRGKCISLSVVS